MVPRSERAQSRRSPFFDARGRLPAAMTVQRTPHGLATMPSTAAFTGDAYTFWQNPSNHDKPLRDLSDFLVDLVNAALPCPCAREVRSLAGGVSGQFDHTTWTILADPERFSKRDGVSTVGALTRDEVANIVNTIYHEARHAEQDFLIAQRRVGQGEDAQTIATALRIPLQVAEQAVGQPLTGDTAANKVREADAEVWERFMFGKYLGYGLAVQDLEKAAIAVRETAPDSSRRWIIADVAREAAYKAYRDFAHEKDAFAVGDAAAVSFKDRHPANTTATIAPTAAAGPLAAAPRRPPRPYPAILPRNNAHSRPPPARYRPISRNWRMNAKRSSSPLRKIMSIRECSAISGSSRRVSPTSWMSCLGRSLCPTTPPRSRMQKRLRDPRRDALIGGGASRRCSI